jgi:hypothetical protein
MATTHAGDSSQRLVDLPIVCRDACTLTVNVTDNANLAPPGWYMLYIVDDCGIPSSAVWVHLGPPKAGQPLVQPAHHEIQRSHGHRPAFDIPGQPPRRPPRTPRKSKSRA